MPPAQSIEVCLRDGVRIVAILFVWGAVASVFTLGLADFGLPFESLRIGLGRLAAHWRSEPLLYVLYRSIDDRRATGRVGDERRRTPRHRTGSPSGGTGLPTFGTSLETRRTSMYHRRS